MTWIGTRETREARRVAQLTDAAERAHRRDCIACMSAVRRRRSDERCLLGLEMAIAKEEAAAALRRERELDKLPIEGQEELFSADEVARHS